MRRTRRRAVAVGNAVVDPAAAVGILGQDAGGYMDVLVAAPSTAGNATGPGRRPDPVVSMVVGTGVDPVTYRFSGDRSAN